MSTRFSPHGSFGARAPFYLALLLLVLSVLVSLTSGYLLYQLFREAKTEEIGQGLLVRAVLLTDQIARDAEVTMSVLRDPANESIAPDDDAGWREILEDAEAYDSASLRRIADALTSLRELSRLDSVQFLTPNGRVIVDESDLLQPGDRAAIPESDLPTWQAALDGKASHLLDEAAGTLRARVYAPVRFVRIDTDDPYADEVGAVLRIESSQGFESIRALERRGLLLAGVVVVLMATVAVLFYRLMRVIVQVHETAAHSDRLQAMGALTAAIAHEIRNPLGIIRAFSEGLRDDFEQSDPRREMAEDITGEVERLNGLVTQYLQFAQPQTGGADAVSTPAEVIPAVVRLLEKHDGATVPIAVEGLDDLPDVAISEAALRQLLLNLLMNAREAVLDRGESPSGQPPAIEIQCSTLRGPARVQIRISDNGPGISARDRRRVFDPFFTTRAQGTGLGLAICRHLVVDTRGTIEIESGEGEGTTVRVALPTATHPKGSTA